MELFIQIKNGQPFEHPIFGDNFRQAFPEVNTNNLPDWVAKFERLPPPAIGVYEVYEGSTYEWDNAIVKDVHHIREMTNIEKLNKQNQVKENWLQHGFSSWVFNESLCSFEPPIPMPLDGKTYRWDEAALSWIEVTK